MRYVVDVFRELVQTIEVEADSREQAENKAFDMDTDGKLVWSLKQMTDETEVTCCGEVKDGERQYY